MHHRRTEGVWLITYKRSVPHKYVDYASTVEEALCFGWIDSLPRKLDEQRRMLYFCPRRPKSVWSRLNKERFITLIASKRMAAAGLKKMEAAKRDGSWTAIDAAEAMEMPPDLLRALRKNRKANLHYEAFPPGARKQIIGWVLGAKTESTRARRIATSVALAEQNLRANGQTVRMKP
ncbi:MAG: YdeI/OmpD-associated family protein [Flavobacteriales bacterium]|nr:YdeI/OmpD-associated family protein [Flavobacteriales bacterium]